MKNFYSFVMRHIKCHIMIIILSVILCSLSASFPKEPLEKLSIIPRPAICYAKTVLAGNNTTVAKACSLSIDTLYENSINRSTTQYYRLSGQKNSGTICITIRSKQIPSFSFQLFDCTGASHSPSAYQYEPSNQTLLIKYFFSANENYLFSLCNLFLESNSYTIKYTIEKTISQNKQENTPIPKNKPKQQTSSKPKTKPILKAKPTSKPQTNPHSDNKNKSIATPKQKNTKKRNTVLKPKNNVKKITLSRTFLRVSLGKSFSLKANIIPRKSDYSCQWSISVASLLTDKRQKKVSNGSIFTAKTCRKGTAIITCKTTGKKQYSASCTIKII